jgi:RHS repeat-associated protein
MIDVDISGDTWYFYHYDGLGSVVALSNISGVIVEQYSYDAFGSTTITTTPGYTSPNNPYMFTARRYDDETGLYYYRMRYYSPQQGRFLQPDPIGYADGMNIYAYVGNNPLNSIDPWGLVRRDSRWTEQFLEKQRERRYNPIRHGGNREYDFGYNEYADDTFVLSDGRELSDTEFGNYVAGYLGGYHLGDLGYIAMRGAGNWFGNQDKYGKDSGDYRRFRQNNVFSGDCRESVRDINGGYDDGVRQKYSDYKSTLEAIGEVIKTGMNSLVDLFGGKDKKGS